MKTYFNDENLIDSDKYYHLNGKASYMLFETISAVYPFVKFEGEIRAINDYCVFILDQLKNRLVEIAKDSNYVLEFTSCKKIARDSIMYFEEVLDYPTPLLTWEILSADINKYTMLLLWLSYLESSLDEIARWFCDVKNISFGHKNKKVTGVIHCLEKISLCCGCNLVKELSKEIIYYNEIRKIRNQFVHREWEQVSDRDQQFQLDKVVNLVSTIIAATERRAYHAEIIS